MNNSSIGIQELAARDRDSDRLSIEGRLNYFKNREQTVFHKASREDCDWHGESDTGLPAVDASQFSVDVLRDAMRSKGALLVRGLLNPDVCDHLARQIDLILETPERPEHNPASCRNPPSNLAELFTQEGLNYSRMYLAEAGSAMSIESAGTAEILLNLYTDLGLRELMKDYFEEEPCLSAKKWVLRRIANPSGDAGWHQDGSFMGEDINSLNMWLPLNHCGSNSGAPGLEIVPKRLSEIYSSKKGAFEWSADTNSVHKWFPDHSPVCPEFEAGDALFFDHFNLHRTQYYGTFNRPRYAIESWFFGENSFPKNQVAMKW